MILEASATSERDLPVPYHRFPTSTVLVVAEPVPTGRQRTMGLTTGRPRWASCRAGARAASTNATAVAVARRGRRRRGWRARQLMRLAGISQTLFPWCAPGRRAGPRASRPRPSPPPLSCGRGRSVRSSFCSDRAQQHEPRGGYLPSRRPRGRARAPRLMPPKVRWGSSAFTLGSASLAEKSMKPFRGFFDLGFESFPALAAGLAMVKSAGARRSARGVGSRARREVGCGARHAATARSAQIAAVGGTRPTTRNPAGTELGYLLAAAASGGCRPLGRVVGE